MSERKGPKIICFDLETMPDMEEVIKVFPSLSDWPGRTLKASICSIISFGWKESGRKRANCISAWDFPSRWKKNVNDDYDVCKAAYEVLKTADVVVTQNGKRFDWKFLQTRLIKHGFPRLPRILHIDLKVEVKKNFLLYDNRLGTIGQWLVEEDKMKHEGWSLWVKVWKRDKMATSRMGRYCKQDVNLLDKCFLKIKSYISQLPNMNHYRHEKMNCPSCGSLSLKREGYKMRKTGRVSQFSCTHCGSWCSVSEKDKMPRGDV